MPEWSYRNLHMPHIFTEWREASALREGPSPRTSRGLAAAVIITTSRTDAWLPAEQRLAVLNSVSDSVHRRRAYPLDYIQCCVPSSVVADNKLVDAIGVGHFECGEEVALQAAGMAPEV